MLALLALIAYLYFHPGSGNIGNSISAEDFSTTAKHTAPDFILNDLLGRKVSLNEYKGKVVLLGFWTTW